MIDPVSRYWSIKSVLGLVADANQELLLFAYGPATHVVLKRRTARILQFYIQVYVKCAKSMYIYGQVTTHAAGQNQYFSESMYWPLSYSNCSNCIQNAKNAVYSQYYYCICFSSRPVSRNYSVYEMVNRKGQHPHAVWWSVMDFILR